MKKLLSCLLVAGMLFFTGNAFAVDQEVKFGWDHDNGATGFKIYAGFSSGQYSEVTDVGMATPCTESEYCHDTTIDVPDNAITTMYFAATAYGPGDIESEFSNEVSRTWDFVKPPAASDFAGTYNQSENAIDFSWIYSTAWLDRIEKWALYVSDTAGGPYTPVVDIPYDPNASQPYTTSITDTNPDGQVTHKYYVLVTFRPAENNNAFSVNSSEIHVVIDKTMSAPFNFKLIFSN